MTIDFDPNSAALEDSGVFGLPYTAEESEVILLPIPWEATTSYGGGTSEGPAAIMKASRQVDLFDLELGPFYEAGIAMLDIPNELWGYNDLAKLAAQSIIEAGGIPPEGLEEKQVFKQTLKAVNETSEKINEYVYQTTKKHLAENQIVGLVGGDHSCPFGSIKAYLEKYPNMGVLHFDAHADLRNAYEGFEYSHASIFHNVLTKTKLSKLVQVGIRDFCQEEFDLIKKESSRVSVFFDQKISEMKFEGKSWDQIADEIIKPLPQEVYISFDIDGLDPILCPHTGTPVPGGLSFQEAVHVFKKVVRSGRKIVGFDLNEVAPGPEGNEWDANVGARLLFKLCGWTLESQKK